MFVHVEGGFELEREAEIHDLDRVPVAAGQIDETPFAEQIEAAPVGQRERLDIGPRQLVLDGQRRQFMFVDLDVEVPRVAHDRVVFHELEMLCPDHVRVAGKGEKNVAQRRRLGHGHQLVAVHDRFERAVRIQFGDDDAGAEGAGAHGGAPAAPAVTGDDHRFPRHEDIGRAHEAVPHGLPGAVAVIEKIFAVGVVHGDHRKRQNPLPLHGLQAFDAGGRLLGSALDGRDQLLHVGKDRRHQIGAVVHDDRRAKSQRIAHIAAILFAAHGVTAEHGNARIDESGADIVLRRERIAAGRADFGAQLFESPQQAGGLRFKVEAG